MKTKLRIFKNCSLKSDFLSKKDFLLKIVINNENLLYCM